MYKVLVADDEPMAIQMITKIITNRSRQFVVCDTAQDGQEALDKIRKQKPDLVITDIRMPAVSGLRIAEILRDEQPDIHVIIVSGYQSFDYAQWAIRSGAADYILKPIVPSAMVDTLRRVEEKIRSEHYVHRKRLLREIVEGRQYDREAFEKLFPYSNIYTALLRRNGLPRRFSKTIGEEIFSGTDDQFIVYGRDEMEALYLVPEEMIGSQTMLQYMLKVMKREQQKEGYMTVIYDNEPFPSEKITERTRSLYLALEKACTIGFTQTIDIHSLDIRKEDLNAAQNSQEIFFQETANLLKLKKYDALRLLLHRQYKIWTAEKRPQYWLEYVTNRLYHLFICHTGNNQDMVEEERMLDDAFTNALTAEDLENSVIEILFQNQQEPVIEKVDSPEFFKKIETYLEEHLQEDISLDDICLIFGVSQTYISRMFRKYTDMSYNKKLTELRMEKAKKLIAQNTSFYIKEIAGMVGYHDQFYFSRVFHSYVGKSPSEYAEEIAKDPMGF